MITLFQFPPAFGLPVSVSQYCTKLELYLRATGRGYKTETADLRKSPNKKVPYVGWPDGSISAETDEIIVKLESSGTPLDEGLSASEIAAGKVLQGLAEGPVYYGCLYSRFVEDSGWEHQRGTVKEVLPALLAPILVPIIRRAEKKLCARNGFENRDGYESALDAIQRIRDALGDNPYILGDKLRTADCSIWANILHTAYTKADNPARHAVRGDEVLMAYAHRLADKFGWKLPALS